MYVSIIKARGNLVWSGLVFRMNSGSRPFIFFGVHILLIYECRRYDSDDSNDSNMSTYLRYFSVLLSTSWTVVQRYHLGVVFLVMLQITSQIFKVVRTGGTSCDGSFPIQLKADLYLRLQHSISLRRPPKCIRNIEIHNSCQAGIELGGLTLYKMSERYISLAQWQHEYW